MVKNQRTGCVDNNLDFNDTDYTQGGSEWCDGINNDCVGLVDEGFKKYIWHLDADGDSHGLDTVTLKACFKLPDYTIYGDECNDSESWINPGAIKYDDSYHTDCNDIVVDCYFKNAITKKAVP